MNINDAIDKIVNGDDFEFWFKDEETQKRFEAAEEARRNSIFPPCLQHQNIVNACPSYLAMNIAKQDEWDL